MIHNCQNGPKRKNSLLEKNKSHGPQSNLSKTSASENFTGNCWSQKLPLKVISFILTEKIARWQERTWSQT